MKRESVLSHLLEIGGMADRVEVESVVHEIKILPKTKEDRNKINEGNYPRQYSLFTHFISLVSGRSVKNQFEILSEHWFKDKKTPFIVIRLRETFL